MSRKFCGDTRRVPKKTWYYFLGPDPAYGSVRHHYVLGAVLHRQGPGRIHDFKLLKQNIIQTIKHYMTSNYRLKLPKNRKITPVIELKRALDFLTRSWMFELFLGSLRESIISAYIVRCVHRN